MLSTQACNDAFVGLADIPWQHRVTYELCLGCHGNTQSYIREFVNGTMMTRVTAQTVDLLNCDVSVSFWLTWINGTISIGQGVVVGSEQFATWTDPQPKVVGAVSMTTGYGSVGQWIFPRDSGRYAEFE